MTDDNSQPNEDNIEEAEATENEGGDNNSTDAGDKPAPRDTAYSQLTDNDEGEDAVSEPTDEESEAGADEDPEGDENAEAEQTETDGSWSADSLNLKEGQEVNPELLDKYVQDALKEGLGLKEAQFGVDFWQEQVEAGNQAYRDMIDTAVKAVKDDPDFGGDNLKQSYANVTKAITRIGGAEAGELQKAILEDPITGNNLTILKALESYGKRLQEPKTTKTGKTRKALSPEEQADREEFPTHYPKT